MNAIDYRSVPSDERRVHEQLSEQNQLTPARRAALDALEREFRDLLHAVPR